MDALCTMAMKNATSFQANYCNNCDSCTPGETQLLAADSDRSVVKNFIHGATIAWPGLVPARA